MTDRLSKKASRTRLQHFTILGGAFLCMVILFSSCDNFLDDSGTREQILKRFEYQKSPLYTILVSDTDSSGVVNTPAGGQTRKKVTDAFTVSFSPQKEYDFLYWTIIDDTTKQDSQNGEYLLLSSLTDPETECTFLKAPEPGMSLKLVPIMAERPSVDRKSPVYVSAGVEKTSDIIVTFTRPMNPLSIYYTQDEITQLTEQYELLDTDFLSADNYQTQTKYYGYQKDGNIVFKNIQITNYRDSTNLLEFFNAPYFESASVLKISPKSTLPGGNMVFVILDKNFNYIEQINNDTKAVCMCKSFSWQYFVK